MSFYDNTFGLCIPPLDFNGYLKYEQTPEVVCTVRLAIGFLLVLSKWCAQSRLAIGF